jgi:outer membrane translocation and assembly module TamA
MHLTPEMHKPPCSCTACVQEARAAEEEALKREEQRKLAELREEEARQAAAKAEEERKAALAAKKAQEQEAALEKKLAADKALVDKMNSGPSDEPSRVLILYSSLSSDSTQVMNQRRLDDLIKSYKYDYIRIDGASAENKDLRSKLFDVSQHRGKYPQCFVQTGENYQFIGLWDQVSSFMLFILPFFHAYVTWQ